MKSMMSFEKYSKYFFILMLTIGLASCEDDDDVTDPEPMPDPTGSITANDQAITANTIMVQSVSVGQDSWLAAVKAGEEETDNFIADPVFIEGEDVTTSDVTLTIYDDANLETDEDGQEVILKLYAEDDDGVWDIDDEPIWDEDGTLATETITVTMEDAESATFADLDTDDSGTLDETEYEAFYDYDYTEWDADEDGVLNEDEFYTVNFANADTDDDDTLSADEWDMAYTTTYGTYITEEELTAYDTDEDGFLNFDEWSAGFVDSDWFDTYDADDDTFVDDTELSTGFYNDWDTDDDGFLNEDEYNVYSPYYYAW